MGAEQHALSRKKKKKGRALPSWVAVDGNRFLEARADDDGWT